MMHTRLSGIAPFGAMTVESGSGRATGSRNELPSTPE